MMSGGSQHNPNGRQAQLAPAWNPLQLASYLARAPQAHMASERGVTWHTPTPPHHLYNMGPEPPDPLQGMKVGAAAGNSVFRHTATPPELYRHTPTPPDKHLLSRHTPSPGDVKGGSTIPLPDLYSHLGGNRDKIMRGDDLTGYSRGGVDLSVCRTNGNAAPLSLSVRDAPTINSLLARRPAPSRVEALLERLTASPAAPAASPHSVIVQARSVNTPSPPSSEDSTDSPSGAKRKRKPERTIRLPAAMPLTASPPERHSPAPVPLRENGDTANHTTDEHMRTDHDTHHTRRKTRSASAETIDDIAAMIASTDKANTSESSDPNLSNENKLVTSPTEEVADTPTTIARLKDVLASPEPAKPDSPKTSPTRIEEIPMPDTPVVEIAAAPRRRSVRTSNTESTNVPVESPSEGKPAETSINTPMPHEEKSTEPTAASFVEVETELEKMFAGIEEPASSDTMKVQGEVEGCEKKAKKRPKPSTLKTVAAKKILRKSSDTPAVEPPKKKPGKKKVVSVTPIKRKKGRSKEAASRDAYDSGSNASSGRSRGPYIQIRGPRDSPLSVSVVNATTGDDDADPPRKPIRAAYRNGVKARGLHCSTLGARYDATTPDASWVCIFCERGPHSGARERATHPLGDLFGPYTVSTECEDFLALDEKSRQHWGGEASGGGTTEVWTHEECAVWAPGVLMAGARAWGLASGVWSARAVRCVLCGAGGAGLACAARGCAARAHVVCARSAAWTLHERQFRALCPRHAAPPLL